MYNERRKTKAENMCGQLKNDNANYITLKWNDFDADFTYLRIDESRTDNIFENTTKTENSNRIIPLIGFLQTELKELLTTYELYDSMF